MNLLLKIVARLIQLRHGQLILGKHVRIEPAFLARGGEIQLSDNVTVRLGTIMMPATGSIRVGANTTINHYCVIHGGNGLRIGQGCLIAPRVSIFAANHGFQDASKSIREQGMTDKGGVQIGDDVWIGTGAIILDGVQIGTGAVIGAGSVVTKDVEPFSVNVGNPAKSVGSRQ